MSEIGKARQGPVILQQLWGILQVDSVHHATVLQAEVVLVILMHLVGSHQVLAI